ncbi:LCP family protein [Clostridium sp.]|jgi:LCP family protein required for cell wall assembly|uniref:LCP family protein n=1 Tax=Clostridium sp. TaxID=1506 RepID=UPI0025B7DFD9|nr:LCP family protein [Clostridium sp.]MCI9069096.1 LCP family protein [Clostridium sp.]
MAINKDNRGGNGRRISNKINRGDLTPKEQLNIKRKLRKKEKRSTIIKRAILALILTVLILVTLSGIYLFSFISSLNNSDVIAGVKPRANETVNILLLGMDIGDSENISNTSARRTDTMILLNYNPRTDNIKVVSIPRDTLIEVENAHDGEGNYIPYWKINAAYALGGEEEVIEQVEGLLDITVNYLIEIDYAAFRNLIDAVGGVEMFIERDMYYDDDAQDLHINFNKGETVLLDGQKAEEFFRWRKNNDGTGLADGDLGRIKNQQKFISALIEKCTNPMIVTQIPDILKSIKENVITNMPGTEMIKYGLKMISNSGTSMNTLQGYNERIYGQDFLVADSSYNRSIIESLKITSEADNSEEKKNSSIMVLNATRVNGLAGNLKTELEKLGYATISTGNYEKSKESSILSNNKDLRKLLSEDTGIKNLSKNKESEYQDYDAVIIIGEDYLEFR